MPLCHYLYPQLQKNSYHNNIMYMYVYIPQVTTNQPKVFSWSVTQEKAYVCIKMHVSLNYGVFNQKTTVCMYPCTCTCTCRYMYVKSETQQFSQDILALTYMYNVRVYYHSSYMYVWELHVSCTMYMYIHVYMYMQDEYVARFCSRSTTVVYRCYSATQVIA